MSKDNVFAGKRRALVKRVGDKTEKIYCDDHPANQATFKCVKCGHLFCEECVGGEDEGKAYCVGCKGFYKQEEQKQLQAEKKRSRKASSGAKKAEFILAGLMICLILVLGNYVYQNSESPIAADTEVFTAEELAEDQQLLNTADRELAELDLEIEAMLQDENVAVELPGATNE
ncbi:B-box zinc finger [Mariprofundus ferrinatatus]|uniref:B-box zinc finger n=1 Tax=Mariprofundus ferrinatatus TaxID=1921087 RepID=A0A2K8L566_9PROT|nr:B-box zinc finger protein [Mariprofundus ferrinatatus]ATX82252.1 B-box zinc finger [Mariprofundus ferrinatatus]